jgi:DNA mismatch endonuclease Vsr
MVDRLTPEQRRRNMQNIRSAGTKPERIIAAGLRKRKIYFSQHCKNILGKPDFVFRRKKIAVFVDSEFWHGHRTKFNMPQSNEEFWANKIERNRKRDRKVNRELCKDGWKVVRIWEQDIKANPEKQIKKILKALSDNSQITEK